MGFSSSLALDASKRDNVVVAMANYQRPRVPPFAKELDPGIVQIHSYDYRNPAQLRDGDVLVVGAGNSGAEIALETSRAHKTWMAGRDVGHVPFDIDGLAARLLLFRLVLRVLFHRILTIATPFGRAMRPKVLHIGGPLVRTKPRDLDTAGVRARTSCGGRSATDCQSSMTAVSST